MLEPWLTESHRDEHYWDNVATNVVAEIGDRPSPATARRALEGALLRAFPGVTLESEKGFFRDNLDRRLDLIVELPLDSPPL